MSRDNSRNKPATTMSRDNNGVGPDGSSKGTGAGSGTGSGMTKQNTARAEAHIAQLHEVHATQTSRQLLSQFLGGGDSPYQHEYVLSLDR